MNKNIYQIRITYSDAGNRREGMPYRLIEFDKDMTLMKMAEFILKQFNFKMAEPFGFYSDLNNWHLSDFKYELFEDDPKAETLKNTYIEDMFEDCKLMLMVYDYLEEHRFLLDFEKSVPERGIITYPELLESMGETPQKSEVSSIFDEDDEDEGYGKSGKKGLGFRSEDEDDDPFGGGGSDGLEDDEDDAAGGDEDPYGFDEFSSGSGGKYDDE